MAMDGEKVDVDLAFNRSSFVQTMLSGIGDHQMLMDMELTKLIKTNRSIEQMLQDIAQVQSCNVVCDVSLCCKDGVIPTSSLIFGTISPMIYKALHQTPQVDSAWSLVLPETNKSEIEHLIQCFFGTPINAENINQIIPVLKTLGVVHFPNFDHTKHESINAGHIGSPSLSVNENKAVTSLKYQQEISLSEKVFSIEETNSKNVLADDTIEQSKSNEDHIRKKQKEKGNWQMPYSQESHKTKTKVEIKQHVKCEICSKVLKKASGLSTHMKFHKLGHDTVGKDSPTVCKECGKMFKTKQEHRQHFARVHIGTRTKLCPMLGCIKAFKSNGELKAHMRTHTKNKEFMCSDCGTNFATKHSLANHTLRKHTTGYNELHHCAECTAEFRMLTDLKSHIHNVHRANEVRRHICIQCGKGFSHKYSLKKHMMIHTDERPIECRICHMRFRTNSNYNKHAKTHLKNTLDKLTYKQEGVELSVQQLATRDGSLHLEMGKAVEAPLHLQLANIPVMSVRTIQPISPHEEEQLRQITSGLLPPGYIV